jgi:hypothetical protein
MPKELVETLNHGAVNGNFTVQQLITFLKIY